MSLELIAAASLVVSGTVTSVVVEPPAAPRVTDLGSTRVVLDTAAGPIAFRVPGDNGERVLVAGVPGFDVGSEWRVELVDGARDLVPRGLGRGLTRLSDGPRWNVNNTSFPDSQLPLVWRLVVPGSTDLGVEATEAALDLALAQWNEVGCSDFEFARGDSYEGDEVVFGDSWVRWEEEVWEQDPRIAGVTAIVFGDVDGEVVPIAAGMTFNGVDWRWVSGPGNAYLAVPEVNIDSVVAHEMGHSTGLAHEVDLAASTMFYAYLGGDWQATLAGDDRRGLCELYGNGEDECAEDEDCADLGSDLFCAEIDGIRVCDEPRDGVGADCSVEDLNCGGYCVLDRLAEGAGYCSVACEAGDCPDGFVCGLTDDTRIPLGDGVALCVPFDPPGDDDDDDDDDDGSECSGCEGGAAVLPIIALAGWGPRRRRSRHHP